MVSIFSGQVVRKYFFDLTDVHKIQEAKIHVRIVFITFFSSFLSTRRQILQLTARLHDILLLFVSDSGVLLHRVLRPRLLRQPALVPDRGGHQLPRHHLLQHLLPLPSRAAQQTPDQLAHGGQYLLTYLKIFFITNKYSFNSGVLVHCCRHLLLLHRVCSDLVSVC